MATVRSRRVYIHCLFWAICICAWDVGLLRCLFWLIGMRRPDDRISVHVQTPTSFLFYHSERGSAGFILNIQDL